MPPIGNRKTSDARCKQGWQLRCRGRTWQEVADEVNPPFRSKQSAQKAVQTWLRKNPPDDLETMRRATGDMLKATSEKMFDAMEQAIEREKFRDAAELGKVALDGVEKHARLTGQHVVVPKEVNVHVQSFTEIVASTRSQLMAALEAKAADMDAIDAEIVDPPKELA